MAVADPQVAPDQTLVDGQRRRGVPARPKVSVIGMRTRGVVSQPEDRHRSRDGGTPFLLEHDILEVENQDDVDWEFKWERKKYLVRIGEVGHVPFPALVNALGDPRSVQGEMTKFRTDDGQTGLIPTRYESLSTLFARYAVENENITDLVLFAPKVIVRHMETGQIITFPVHDPDCSPWPVPQHAAPGYEPSGDRARIVAIEDENRNLRQEIQEMRQLVNERLSPVPAQPQTMGAGGSQPFDPASALLGGGPPDVGGATPDRGPSGTFE